MDISPDCICQLLLNIAEFLLSLSFSSFRVVCTVVYQLLDIFLYLSLKVEMCRF